MISGGTRSLNGQMTRLNDGGAALVGGDTSGGPFVGGDGVGAVVGAIVDDCVDPVGSTPLVVVDAGLAVVGATVLDT